MLKEQTKLIIVCDDKTKEYANFLRQLISVNDDTEEKIVGIEDGRVNAVVWTEEQYRDNSAKVASNEHVLFIGENKTSKTEINSMPVHFEKYGMSYGWLGKRGMMLVDDALLSQKEYKEFIEFSASYNQYFDKSAYEEQNEEEKEEVEKNSEEQVEKTTTSRKKKNGAMRVISKAAAVVGNKVLKPVAEVIIAGAEGAYDNIKSLAMKKKINDQQYRALTVILYLDGLSEFLEG